MHKEMLFPRSISEGASGGPSYDTRVVTTESGFEYRNRRRNQPLYAWDVSHGVKTPTDMDTLMKFFHVVGGMEDTFRFEDPMDHIALSTEGRLTRAYQTGAFVLDGVGSGEPDYWIGKRYSYDAYFADRKLLKLQNGFTTIYRNASPVTNGVAAGNVQYDNNEGLISFVADASVVATAITPGTTTTFTAATNPLGLAIGEWVWLSGFSGANQLAVNDMRHEISNITGSGPFTFTLTTNTNGLTITLGSGAAFAYPQANDLLTAAFRFDLVARFNVDMAKINLDHYNAFSWPQIPIVEVQLP